MSALESRFPGPSPRTAAMLVAGAAIGLHLGVLGLGFTLDDWPLILDNQGLGRPGHLSDILGNLWRPLQRLSLALNHAVWGKSSALGYHLTSVLWHAAACLAFWRLALALQLGRLGALFAALLFAVHPVHVEVVANICHRKESMALFFGCLAFLCWLKARAEGRSTASRARLILATALLYLLGMLSKEVAGVMLPLVILCFELLQADRSTLRKRIPALLGLLLPVSLVLLLFLLWGDLGAVTRRFGADDILWVTGNQTDSYLVLLRTTVKAFAVDLRLLAWPSSLSVDQPLLVAQSWSDPGFLLGCGLLMGFCAALWSSFKRAPLVCLGLLWFGLHLIPVANVVPLTHWLVAERFLYGPSAGLALALGWLLSRAWEGGLSLPSKLLQKRLSRGLLALILMTHGVLTLCQVRVWKDETTLWTQALAHHPGSIRAHHQLGRAAERAGQLREAERFYRGALELSPGFSASRLHLGSLLLSRGRPAEALPHAQALTQLRAHDSRSYELLGSVLLAMNQSEAALSSFREARRLDPQSDLALTNLVMTLLDLGQAEEALGLVRAALAAGPTALRVVALARCLDAEGSYGEAEQSFNQARRSYPRDPAAPRFFGIFLLERGRPAEALEQLEASLALDPRQGALGQLIEALQAELSGTSQ